MDLSEEERQNMMQSRKIKIYAAIVTLVLNCYFWIAIGVNHIPMTYMVWALVFNAVSFVLLICSLFFIRRDIIYVMRLTAICIFVSTIIFSVYYVKLILFSFFVNLVLGVYD